MTPQVPEIHDQAPGQTPGHDHARLGAGEPAPADDDWRARLRAKGHRLTPQREMILAAVTELGHATPDQVLARVRETSQSVNVSTVYRTLEVLETLGLVRHAHLSDRAPTFHASSEHEHFHLVCRRCGEVTSVEPEQAAPLRDVLRQRHGFEMDVGHLTVFGTCVADCAPADAED